MKRIRLLSFALLMLCAVFARAQPSQTYPCTMFVIYNGAEIYDSATYKSAVIGKTRIGDSIRVLGVGGRYYRIAVGEREGYILWSNLSGKAPVKKDKAGRKRTGQTENAGTASDTTAMQWKGDAHLRIIDSSDTGTGKKVSSGSAAKPASAGAETQCRATTRSGQRCTRSAGNSSGYCWQHNR